MSSMILSGDTSGAVTVTVPAVAGTNTITFPAATGTVMVSGNNPTFSAYQNGSQTITNATFTKLTLNAENFDTAGAFDSTTNYRFTPLVAGYYQINGAWGSSTLCTATQAILTVYKNGVAFAQLSSVGAVSGYPSPAGSAIISMNGTTDYLEFYAYQNSGISIATIATSQLTCSGSLIRTA